MENPVKHLTVLSLTGLAFFVLLSGLCSSSYAQQNTTASDEIQVLQLRPNFYMIAGAGGNIAVQIGDDGVVLVDTGSGTASERVLAEIKKLTNKPIRYIIDTSADADRVGGNETFSKAGKNLIPVPENGTGAGRLADALTNGGGAAIFAHDNVAERMSAAGGEKPTYSTYALPSDTYKSREKDTFLNGEGIQVLHQPAAHTDGDSMVLFRRSDVLVTGEIFNTEHFPVIDLARGGSIQGEIDALNHIIYGLTITQLPLIWQEYGTLVVPGHGRICDQADVVEYRDMVTIIRDVIQDLMKKGDTLEQIKAADPTKEYRRRYGNDSGPWTTDMFVEAVYRSLGGKDQSATHSSKKTGT